MQSVILERVADIFQDYYQTVTLNTQFYIDEHIKADNKSFKTVTGNHMKQSVSIELDVSKSPELCYEKSSVVNMLNTSSANTFSDISSSENIFYDNFKSKISAWKTAADVVSVLHNLGSLVISGIDTVDITEDISLL